MLPVFKYLKHTSDLGIIYSGGNEQLDGWSDADFATSDVVDRRVTSGYVFRLWGGAISWQSKKQPSVSLATGDAEYVPLAQASREWDVATIDHERAWFCTKQANHSFWR